MYSLKITDVGHRQLCIHQTPMLRGPTGLVLATSIYLQHLPQPDHSNDDFAGALCVHAAQWGDLCIRPCVRVRTCVLLVLRMTTLSLYARHDTHEELRRTFRCLLCYPLWSIRDAESVTRVF